MNDLEKRTLDMLKRVRDFFAAHDNLFPAGTLGHDLISTIISVVNDLEGLAAAEAAGRGAARQGTAGKAAARAAIVEDLGILRRTARTMSAVAPGLEEKFRLPQTGDDQELLAVARAALAAAEPYKAEFLRREVRERVFQDLEANIAAFEAALTDQHAGREGSLTAGASIDAAIELGMNTIRQLDPIVRNKLQRDTVTLAAWLSAKRIERAPRRSNHDTNNNPPPDTNNNPNT